MENYWRKVHENGGGGGGGRGEERVGPGKWGKGKGPESRKGGGGSEEGREEVWTVDMEVEEEPREPLEEGVLCLWP